MRERQREFELRRASRARWAGLALSTPVLVCSAALGAALLWRFWNAE